MSATLKVLLLVAGLLSLQGLLWVAILWFIKVQSRKLAAEMREECSKAGKGVVLGPDAALYRGAEARFGKVRGNGVLCLTEANLLFWKLTGQRIELIRGEIAEATVQDSFLGKTSFATGGKHLVIRTKDGNRVGFLIKDAGLWVEKLNP